MNGLQASILTMVNRNGKKVYITNFDERVRGIFREIVCLNRYGCPMPQIAVEMSRRAKKLKIRVNKVQVRANIIIPNLLKNGKKRLRNSNLHTGSPHTGVPTVRRVRRGKW